MKSLVRYIAEQRARYKTIDRDFDALVELEILGAAVYRARRSDGLTQRGLAEASGAPHSWIAAIEAGRRLPAACHVPINALLWPIRDALAREGVVLEPPLPRATDAEQAQTSSPRTAARRPFSIAAIAGRMRAYRADRRRAEPFSTP